MSAQHTPSAWVESNGHGGFAVWQSVGAGKQHIATFKLESAALEYVAIADWRAEQEDLLEELKRALSTLQDFQLSARLTGLERETIVIRCEYIQAAIATAKGGAR